MDTINKKYNIEITVLSPLSIGAGAEKDWVKGVDFVVKDRKIYLLNLKKMIQNGIDPQELTTFFANKDAAGLLGKIKNKLNIISDRIMDLPENSDNDIKSFIKNELTNKPIIPGSSLKGAVRSVILEYLLQGQKPKLLNEKVYFGDSNKGDELMRFIKFSDAEFEETTLVNTKIFNLRKPNSDWLGGWKHEFNNGTTEKFNPNGFNTIYEIIPPKAVSVGNIMLSKCTFDKINHNNKENKDKLFDIKRLFQIINEHTTKYIDKENAFFRKYTTEETKDIVKSLEQIKEQIPEDNSVCILKMSAGSGFHSITGDWQYDDYSKTGKWENGRNRDKQRYKSRKVAIHDGVFSLMGFVKLRIMTDQKFSDYHTKQEQVKQEIAKQKQIERENIKQEQERHRLEQEREKQEEAEKQKLLKEAQFKKEQAEKAEQERLANMSPDDREKEKYQNITQSEIGNLVNESIKNEILTSDFYKWLKQYLDNKKLWSVNVNDKKNKWIKRCLAIEEKIKS
jgi:CRISPR/Cas system CSM-associated protein Csm5 (group 7 of RAMP superfamily)